MTSTMPTIGRSRRQRRVAGTIIVASALATIALMASGWAGGLRVNLTPSEPLGLWRILPLKRPVQVGDVVFICPPTTEAMRGSRERGYLRRGLCPSGVAPLIKTVVGVEGQRADIGRDVRINGQPVPLSEVIERDGEGRAISSAASGMIPAGHVFLHSGFAGSFDSRYFGPVPVSGMLGLAEEVWTYAP
ncbi:conjugative transfer signal peptidase TraF [Shinella sp. CPCC 100929]|uniref:Conjugative transfer signal peptidase TraF n=1 Tax=Shinella lacus TaxID=2654216 RepID=A0ABT1RC06_9HYPH|nr:conjugative transfer signal peptidase TraF [Shinella lacus]MCQ4632725.1 conjugative transfer signal peptidase TraF [Shinella lacus]